jgi:hypothetical protein
MMIAGVQVVLSICNYTFDTTPVEPQKEMDKSDKETGKDSERIEDEEVALVPQKLSAS